MWGSFAGSFDVFRKNYNHRSDKGLTPVGGALTGECTPIPQIRARHRSNAMKPQKPKTAEERAFRDLARAARRLLRIQARNSNRAVRNERR